ncbi:MAG: class I SAM-dependent methyltransferase [Chloroflexi bacterium]|nr:class I SAM-dependent methyltransferase [Chloroflexota bacterium]
MGSLPRCPICGDASAPLPRRNFGLHRTVVCRRCTLEYLLPQPTREETLALYADEGYYRSGAGSYGYPDYEAEREAIARTGHRRLRRLLRYNPGRDLIEVGAAYGYFLQVAQDSGFNVAALEVSDAAVARLRTQFDHVHHGELAEAGLCNAFDVVVLFDTIEHLHDPRAFVEAAHQALRPGGLLAFTTPNNRSMSARLLGKRWWSYRVPEHLYYFNRRSLEHLLHGRFQIVAAHPDSQYFSVKALVARLRARSPRIGRAAEVAVRALHLERLMVLVPNGMGFYIAVSTDGPRPSSA